MTVLTGLLAVSGCMRVITAPARAERREKAENVFANLATFPPERLAAFLDAWIAEKVALTPEQTPRVAAANRAHAERLHALAASDDGVRSKARALREADKTHQANLRAALSPEQFTRFLEMKEQLREALQADAAGKS